MTVMSIASANHDREEARAGGSECPMTRAMVRSEDVAHSPPQRLP